jgi:hypothetical protein
MNKITVIVDCSVIDPEAQLTDMMRLGVSTAANGFQYLLKTSKDVLKMFQALEDVSS